MNTLNHVFYCADCGCGVAHSNGPSNCGGTGYAIDKAGNKTCYDCCGKRDADELAALKPGQKFCLYLTGKPGSYELTNWPSTLKIRPSYHSTGRHNMAVRRYDVWFSYRGNPYHGVQYGENTQICHVKRLKA